MKGAISGETLSLASEIQSIYGLCDHCLGRMLLRGRRAASAHALGRRARIALGTEETPCHICRDIFNDTARNASMVEEAARGYRFKTFLLGIKVKPSIIERDDAVRSRFRLAGTEPVKTAIAQSITGIISARTGAAYLRDAPEMIMLADLKTGSAEMQPRPAYVFARYTKVSGDIPQRGPSCDQCRRAGCRFCGYRGITELDNVEGRIVEYMLEKFRARQAKITWIGGEERTSRVFGDGRPFFAKIIGARIRRSRLKDIIHLAPVTIRGAKIIESMPSVPVRFFSDVAAMISVQSDADQSALVALKGIGEIATTVCDAEGRGIPKKVHSVTYRRVGERRFVLRFVAEGGLPVREFIVGGRVSPSILDITGVKCTCMSFDINSVTIKNAP